MVLGCAAACSAPARAEDAFQATFLVFSISDIHPQDGSLAAWLHGVAQRVARKAARARCGGASKKGGPR